MSDTRLRLLKIKTGVLKRLTKEKITYQKEASQQQEKIVQYKEEGKDEHMIKKQEEVLQETLMMVPDCHGRMLKAYEDLKNFLNQVHDLKDNVLFNEAEKILKESEEQVNSES